MLGTATAAQHQHRALTSHDIQVSGMADKSCCQVLSRNSVAPHTHTHTYTHTRRTHRARREARAGMQTIETRTQCADIKLRARARTRNGWARTPWTARPGLARTFAHACAEAGHDACSSGDASRACTSVCGVGSHQKATGEEHARRRSSCCASRQQGAASSVEEETNASSIVGDVLCRVPAIIILPSYALYPEGKPLTGRVQIVACRS